MSVVRCPWPEWTAYWTPPPTWPRRLLCENSLCTSVLFKDTRRLWICAAAALLTYFLTMDAILFSHFRSADLSSSTSGSIEKGEIYTPFTHLSVKGLLNDHPSQFFIAPSTEYFDMITHFSSIFSFITPNMISFAHLVCGFISGKFMSSDHLLDRRVGVVLYEYRTWLDAFDGTVHRAQEGLRLKYNSNHKTLGYVVDSTFDTLGGCFLGFSLLFYLIKKNRPDSGGTGHASHGKSHNNGQAQHSLLPMTSAAQAPPLTMRQVVLKAISFGVCLAVAGKCWDQAVEDFSVVFQTPLTDENLKTAQYEFCHSWTTLALFYLWRVFGGQSVLNYTLLAIYLDKIETYLSGFQFVLLGMALFLYLITAVYIHHIRSVLML
ncbi:ceramide phosphoethanolamine synthase [Aplysia californica]|uniref:Ceramide phosphoethanolamine synthase n=1 Tax=Aplysia californica TaxID=6500 RepID=A0ABM1A068_APLCA|nr:ceramide phosphoethanolamine synthase [Aplysia californica]